MLDKSLGKSMDIEEWHASQHLWIYSGGIKKITWRSGERAKEASWEGIYGSAMATTSASSNTLMLRICSLPIIPAPIIPYLTIPVLSVIVLYETAIFTKNDLFSARNHQKRTRIPDEWMHYMQCIQESRIKVPNSSFVLQDHHSHTLSLIQWILVCTAWYN